MVSISHSRSVRRWVVTVFEALKLSWLRRSRDKGSSVDEQEIRVGCGILGLQNSCISREMLVTMQIESIEIVRDDYGGGKNTRISNVAGAHEPRRINREMVRARATPAPFSLHFLLSTSWPNNHNHNFLRDDLFSTISNSHPPPPPNPLQSFTDDGRDSARHHTTTNSDIREYTGLRANISKFRSDIRNANRHLPRTTLRLLTHFQW